MASQVIAQAARKNWDQLGLFTLTFYGRIRTDGKIVVETWVGFFLHAIQTLMNVWKSWQHVDVYWNEWSTIFWYLWGSGGWHTAEDDRIYKIPPANVDNRTKYIETRSSHNDQRWISMVAWTKRWNWTEKGGIRKFDKDLLEQPLQLVVF